MDAIKSTAQIPTPAIQIEKAFDKTLDTVSRAVLQHPTEVLDALTFAGVGYLGYRASNRWEGALVGMVGLKLATSPNVIAAVSGVTVLAGLGLCSLFNVLDWDWENLTRTEEYYEEPTPEAPPGEECKAGFTLMCRQEWPSMKWTYICVEDFRIRGYERYGWTTKCSIPKEESTGGGSVG